MKPKGFIPIALAIIISVIAVAVTGVGIYYKVENDKQEQVKTNTNITTNSTVNTNVTANANMVTNSQVNTNTTNQNTNTNNGSISNNSFSYATVRVGDHIGGMVVENLGQFNSNINIDPNAVIQFTGQVTVTGTVKSYFSEMGGINQVCMENLNEESTLLIPKAIEDTRTLWFCFSNREDALAVFPLGTDTSASITLNQYKITDYPSEVFNVALFIFGSLNTSGWRTYTSQTLGYSLQYPPSYTVNESADGTVNVTNANGDVVVDTQYRIDSVDGSLSSWFDTAPVSDVTLDGRAGKKFTYKYCDGPGCGEETVAYVVQHKSKLLGLELVGNYELDSTELAIINSFQFTQ